MGKFRYLRPVPAAFTLPDGTDHHLHQGHEYELPEGNKYIRSLVKQGYLEELPDAPAPVEPSEKVGRKTKPTSDTNLTEQ